MRARAAAWLCVSALAACSIYDTSLLQPGAAGSGGSSADGGGGGAASSGSRSASASVGGGGAAGASSASTVSSTSSTGGGGAGVGGGGAGQGGAGGSGGAGATVSSSAASSSAASSSSASSGSGGGCTSPTQCPGHDDDCEQRTCVGGRCGVEDAAAGTLTSTQTSGDCRDAICDGSGDVTSRGDNADLPSDGNDCTTDACVNGTPTFTPVMAGAACMQSGGKVCKAGGTCVECLTGADCASLVCAMNRCSTAQCTDGVKNGAETGVDCGGGTCPGCPAGGPCSVAGDCQSQSCAGGVCQPTCTDGVKDGAETDVDCGGGACPTCPTSKICDVGGDCASGSCTMGRCADVLVLSQVQTRGAVGGNDEFVEIYNPMSIAATFDSNWIVKSRGATSGLATCASSSLSERFAGTGQIIPAHGHILFTNATVPGYSGAVPGDATYTVGISDAASVVLLHGNTVIDALCFYYDATTEQTLEQCSGPYICEGNPVMNPHDNSSATNTNASLERRPGGASGNTVDTGDSESDFLVKNPADPHDLVSAPTP